MYVINTHGLHVQTGLYVTSPGRNCISLGGGGGDRARLGLVPEIHAAEMKPPTALTRTVAT